MLTFGKYSRRASALVALVSLALVVGCGEDNVTQEELAEQAQEAQDQAESISESVEESTQELNEAITDPELRECIKESEGMGEREIKECAEGSSP